MTLIARIHDLFLANANHMVDSVEDPEKMIKQVIREMDENIRQARAAVVGAVASEKQLAAQLERHRASSKDLARKAESTIAAGEDELAKVVLARKVEHDRIASDLETSWKSAKTTCDSLKAQLETLVAKRTDAARKRESLVARQRAALARKRLCCTVATIRTPEATDAKFARMDDRVSELEAESLAVAEVFKDQLAPIEHVHNLEVAAQVDMELQAIKDRLKTRDIAGDS